MPAYNLTLYAHWSSNSSAGYCHAKPAYTYAEACQLVYYNGTAFSQWHDMN